MIRSTLIDYLDFPRHFLGPELKELHLGDGKGGKPVAVEENWLTPPQRIKIAFYVHR
jgi:hypothetical protein